jgi:hypothetical protein
MSAIAADVRKLIPLALIGASLAAFGVYVAVSSSRSLHPRIAAVGLAAGVVLTHLILQASRVAPIRRLEHQLMSKSGLAILVGLLALGRLLAPEHPSDATKQFFAAFGIGAWIALMSYWWWSMRRGRRAREGSVT